MKRKIILIATLLILFSAPVFAQSITYTVQPGDSMWKIAVKYQIGLSEIIAANPQIKNPALIYPNQKITVPNIDDVKALENEVIRLVNVERAKNGLPALKANWELSRVARMKSQDMINKNYFAHQSPTYGSPFDMMENFGIRFSSAG
ncbi:MAG: SafA/ExsA family spore coat assembly protein, partial [Epulopiscium sp.]|nr:SafA/ExsA family spore coat assembly protein [Candidatus Epulonipiscium sp.]